MNPFLVKFLLLAPEAALIYDVAASADDLRPALIASMALDDVSSNSGFESDSGRFCICSSDILLVSG